jgi:hypothetical protein
MDVFSRAGRITALVLTAAAAALGYALIASHDSLAGAGLLFLGAYYLVALALLLIIDFIVTALTQSNRAIRRAER